MNASDVLNSFLKFANQIPPLEQPNNNTSNLVQAPLLSGQPPQRASAALSNQKAPVNSVSIKPATNTAKPLKVQSF
jgi:hypothetical protein